MKELTIDFTAFSGKKQAHESLKTLLDRPDYIGNNLDALHDVLTSITEPTTVRLIHVSKAKEQIGSYAAGLMRVFCDAATENDHLTVIIL